MKEQLIAFDTAKLAKGKGFKDCIHYNGMGDYFTNTTQSLLQKWLREVHKISVTICGAHKSEGYYFSIHKDLICENDSTLKLDTYEEALEKGLQESLKLIK